TIYRALIGIAEEVVASAKIALEKTAMMHGKDLFAAMTIDALREQIGVVSKNAPDDLGLLLENFELAATSGDDLIAIGPAACVPPGADTPSHAAAPLFGAVFTLHLPDETADADQNRIGCSVMNGIDLDPKE